MSDELIVDDERLERVDGDDVEVDVDLGDGGEMLPQYP
jgi:hypothetical protein